MHCLPFIISLHGFVVWMPFKFVQVLLLESLAWFLCTDMLPKCLYILKWIQSIKLGIVQMNREWKKSPRKYAGFIGAHIGLRAL